MKRLPNLDVLRFILATLVILFHIPQLAKNQGLPYFSEAPIFHRGTEAVYMFFVLSGYLIIGQIANYKQRGVFSIKRFYARRALRILPLYYLIVVFGFIFYWKLLPFMGFNFPNTYPLWKGLLLTCFFLPNVFASLYTPGGILEILWSIGIEEQFYLFIAPLLFWVTKQKLLRVLVLLLLLYFLVFHLDFAHVLRQFSMVYFFLFGGGIIAVLEQKGALEFLKKTLIIPLGISIFVGLYFTTNWFLFETLWVRNLFVCVMFSLFVHTISVNHRGVIIENKYLNYFGRISYGIYMYHAISMNLVVFLFLKFPEVPLSNTLSIFIMNVSVIGLTLLVSHLSYRYFETYFLNLKSKFRK